MTRKNIKVPESLFLAMRDDKGDNQSWPHYLEEQCLHGGSADVGIDSSEIASQVTADLVAQLPPKIADELR